MSASLDRPWHALPAVAVVAALLSCAEAGPSVTVRLQLEAPEPADVEAPLRDALGLFNLEMWPLFVALSVEGPGMEPIGDQWPQSAEDWQTGSTEVEFTLEVPAGKSRTVTAVAYRWSGGKTHCYIPNPPETVLDLDAETPASLDLVLAESTYGTAAVELPAGISELWLVDADALVRLDRKTPIEAFVKFGRVPLGRSMRLATVDSDGKTVLLDGEPFLLSSSAPDVSIDLTAGAR